MLELLEWIAYGIMLLAVGSFLLVGALTVVDKIFRFFSFVIVKIFIDRQATYATFNTCWDDAKRRV